MSGVGIHTGLIDPKKFRLCKLSRPSKILVANGRSGSPDDISTI